MCVGRFRVFELGQSGVQFGSSAIVVWQSAHQFGRICGYSRASHGVIFGMRAFFDGITVAEAEAVGVRRLTTSRLVRDRIVQPRAHLICNGDELRATLRG